MSLMRTVEGSPAWRTRLVDLDARLREMDALGQDMAVLSLNPPGVQPYPAADAVPLAREFNDAWPRSNGGTRTGSAHWPR